MGFWNYIEFLSWCHQPRSSISIRLEMTGKTRLLLQTQDGRKFTFYFMSVTALDKTIFFSYFRKFLLLMWCQRVVMIRPYALLTWCHVRLFWEIATEKGAHTIEHGLKKICFQVMRGDRVVLLQNTSKKAYQCNWWNVLMSTRLK